MNVEELSVYTLEAVTKGMGVTDDVMEAQIKKLLAEERQDIADRMATHHTDMVYQYLQMRRIIAYAYQIAGAHDCPADIMDVLGDPEGATEEQIAAMLPYHVPERG